MKRRVEIGTVKIGQIYIENDSQYVYQVEDFVYEYDFKDDVYYRVFTLVNIETDVTIHVAENIILKHGTIEKWKGFETA